MPDEQMLPMLKGHVFFQENTNGVYFNGGSESSFLFGGKGLYPLVSRLIAAMDGRRSYAAITTALPPQVTTVFNSLFTELEARRLLVDNRAALTQLPEAWHSLYSDTIGYLRDSAPDFADAFAQWRRKPVLAVGSGYVLKSLLRALARAGSASLTVVLDGTGQVDETEMTAALRNHGQIDPEFHFHVAASLDETLDQRDSQRIVVASDNLDLRPGSALSVLLDRAPPGLVVGGLLDGIGLVGPQTISGAADFRDLADRLRKPPELLPHSITSRSVIGNLLALQLIRLENGLARNDRRQLRNWAFMVSPGPEVLLRPVFSVARPDRAAVAGVMHASPAIPPADRDALPLETLHARLATVFDPMTGLFSRNAGKLLAQIPISLDRVEVFWPASYGLPSKTLDGWGLNSNDAGMRALMRAICCYAAGVENHLGQTPGGDLVAAPSEDEWRSEALVAAMLAEPILTATRQTTILSNDLLIAQLADARASAGSEPVSNELRELDTLLRLCATDYAAPRLTLTRIGPFGPFRCQAAGPEGCFNGSGLSARRALIEALGALCATRQAKSSSDVPVISPSPAIGAESDGLDLIAQTSVATLESWLAEQGFKATPRKFDADPIFATYEVVVGRIVLEPI